MPKDAPQTRTLGVSGNLLVVCSDFSSGSQAAPVLAALDRNSGALRWQRVHDFPDGHDKEFPLGFCPIDADTFAFGSLVLNSSTKTCGYFYRIIEMKTGDVKNSGKLSDGEWKDHPFIHFSAYRGRLLVLCHAGIFVINQEQNHTEQLAGEINTSSENSLISNGTFFYLNLNETPIGDPDPITRRVKRTLILNGLSSIPGSRIASYEVGPSERGRGLFRRSDGNFTIFSELTMAETCLFTFNTKTKQMNAQTRFSHQSYVIEFGMSKFLTHREHPLVGVKLNWNDDGSAELFSVDPHNKLMKLNLREKGDEKYSWLLQIDSYRFLIGTRLIAEPGSQKLRMFILTGSEFLLVGEIVLPPKSPLPSNFWPVSAGDRLYVNSGQDEITEIILPPG